MNPIPPSPTPRSFWPPGYARSEYDSLRDPVSGIRGLTSCHSRARTTFLFHVHLMAIPPISVVRLYVPYQYKNHNRQVTHFLRKAVIHKLWIADCTAHTCCTVLPKRRCRNPVHTIKSPPTVSLFFDASTSFRSRTPSTMRGKKK